MLHHINMSLIYCVTSWGTPTSASSQLRQREIQLQLILDEQKTRNNARQAGSTHGGAVRKGSASGQRDIQSHGSEGQSARQVCNM
jgi:hypothetical protein